MELTIFTPTYQREEYLGKLYKSLCNQSNKDFKWLVIDDGSTDGTGVLVNGWIGEAPFEIQYEYKENGGKQTAINRATELITTKMTFIVDSDDWLTEDSVETILSVYDKYKDDNSLCGFSFWRVFPDGKPNGPIFKYDEWKCSFFEARILHNNGGDKAEVWYTECLREYPFPEFENEKYYPEDGIWVRMSGPYNLIHFNKGIYIGEYLEGGITDSNIAKRMKRWPKGMVHRSLAYLNNKCSVKTLVKHSILYTMYGLYGAKYSVSKLFLDTPQKALFILTFLPSIVIGFFIKNRHQTRKNWRVCP